MDIDGRYNPEICGDIRQLSYRKLPTPDVWASPPCDQYARCRAKKPRNYAVADSLVAKAIEIVKYFQGGGREAAAAHFRIVTVAVSAPKWTQL